MRNEVIHCPYEAVHWGNRMRLSWSRLRLSFSFLIKVRNVARIDMTGRSNVVNHLEWFLVLVMSFSILDVERPTYFEQIPTKTGVLLVFCTTSSVKNTHDLTRHLYFNIKKKQWVPSPVGDFLTTNLSMFDDFLAKFTPLFTPLFILGFGRRFLQRPLERW